MDALLIDRWISTPRYSTTADEAAVAVARDEVRAAARQTGFSDVAIGELAIVVSELATNQLRHARLGRIAIERVARDGVAGLEIVAADRGPGIADPTAALAGIPRFSGSLGTGLSSVLRLSDEVDFDVRQGEGTCVRARKFVSEVRRRREVAILARPYEGESRSGDDASFRRVDDRLYLAVCDGLGHGVLAREASSLAIDVAARHEALEPLFASVHEELRATRGAVLSVIEIDERDDELVHAAVGNVVTHVVGPTGTRAYGGPSAVLGARGSLPARIRPEHQVLGPRDVVVLFSDGLTARARIEPRDGVLREHPLAIADHLVRTFGRDSDDVTVLVAR